MSLRRLVLAEKTITDGGSWQHVKMLKSALLQTYGITFDEDSAELKSMAVSKEQVAPLVMRFLAFMLRLQDLALMAAERAASGGPINQRRGGGVNGELL